jgi:hemoglobin/transferrin/lactoferrin receptor protein
MTLRAGWITVILLSARAAGAQPANDAKPEPPADQPADLPAEPTPAASGVAEPEDSASAEEVIEVQSRWPDADLFMVGQTSRATTTRRVDNDTRAGVLGEALDGIAGVAVQRTGPGQGAPIIRGLIGSAVLVVVDGMRLNNSLFRPAPNQYTALVDPLAISRVEVTRGPGSALFGSDAIGGVINVISRLPRFEGEEWTREASVTTVGATADASIVGRVTAATGRRGSGIAVGTTLQHHGDLRGGGGEMQEPSSYNSFAADATAHVEHGKNATTAWLQFVEQPSLPRTDEMRAGFGQETPGSAVFRYQPSRRSFAHVRHLIRRPVGWLEGVELHAAFQRIRDDRLIRDFDSNEELSEANHDDSVGVAARTVGPMLGGELAFGVDYWFDRVASARTVRDIVTSEVTTDQARFADGSMAHQIGAFAEARRTIGRVALRVALRAGLTRNEIAVADREIGATLNALNWAGELGGEYKLRDDLFLVVNAGRAFRAPNIQDLSGLGPRPNNRYQVPSNELVDEQSFGADIGVRARRDRLDVEVFGFGLINDNRIEVIETGEIRPDGAMVVTSANTAEARMVGVEGAIRVRPSPTLEVEAASTYVHGEQSTVAGDEPADRLPPASGRAFVRWKVLPQLRLDGGFRGALAQRRLSQRDIEDPRINPEGTPAFGTLHVGANLKLGDFLIALRGDNLLDRHYREHGSGTAAAGFDASLLVHWTSKM